MKCKPKQTNRKILFNTIEHFKMTDLGLKQICLKKEPIKISSFFLKTKVHLK